MDNDQQIPPDSPNACPYCKLWDTSPETLEKKGIPRGYCAFCQVCGEPGHIRHFPGAVPYSGAWCDKHYRRLLWFHPYGSFGCLFYTFVLAAAAFVLWRWLK